MLEKIRKSKKINRIFLSIDMGILFMGVFMMFIGIYTPICGTELNNTRITIGSVCAVIWFLIFPLMDRDEKDKLMIKIGIHAIFSVVVLVICGFGVSYLSNNIQKGDCLFNEIGFCFGGVFVFSYFIYIIIEYLKVTFSIFVKVRKIIFPRIEKESFFIKNIELLTSAILTITAFVSSIIGFIKIVKLLIDIIFL